MAGISRRNDTLHKNILVRIRKKSFFLQVMITNIGIPDDLLMTCRKITTTTGPLYRDGGFYIEKDHDLVLCILNQVLCAQLAEIHFFFICNLQIYKSPDGSYLAVAEVLLDVSRNFPDPFLQEMALKTWRRSGRLLLLEQLDKVRLILYFLKILFHFI